MKLLLLLLSINLFASDVAIATKSIVQSEGFRNKPYKDHLGNLTIGYGTRLSHISQTEAQLLLNHRLQLAHVSLMKHKWFRDLNEVRRSVILSMGYNIGITGVLRFKSMIYFLKRHNYREASLHMIQSRWATQLPNRSRRLATTMNEG